MRGTRDWRIDGQNVFIRHYETGLGRKLSKDERKVCRRFLEAHPISHDWIDRLEYAMTVPLDENNEPTRPFVGSL